MEGSLKETPEKGQWEEPFSLSCLDLPMFFRVGGSHPIEKQFIYSLNGNLPQVEVKVKTV